MERHDSFLILIEPSALIFILKKTYYIENLLLQAMSKT